MKIATLAACAVFALSAIAWSPLEEGGWLPVEFGVVPAGDNGVGGVLTTFDWFVDDGEEQVPTTYRVYIDELADVMLAAVMFVDPDSGQEIPMTVMPVSWLDGLPGAGVPVQATAGSGICWAMPVSTPWGPDVEVSGPMPPHKGPTLSVAAASFSAQVQLNLSLGYTKARCTTKAVQH